MQMHAPLWNGKKLGKVSSIHTTTYVRELGFFHDRLVETGGVAIYAVYVRKNREVWIPLLKSSIDYLNQLCVLINDIALVSGLAQSDVYEAITQLSEDAE
jgi:hypothetical protein